MLKTTFKGYVPKLKLKGAEATIVGGKAHQSKGGSIRYSLQGEYEGHKTLPKTVSKHDFENVYGFDAKEAEAVIISGSKDGESKQRAHKVGQKEKDGFIPVKITPIEEMPNDLLSPSPFYENHADTVGSPSPASVEPPAPSEKPFPQEPSNENFSADNEAYYQEFELRDELEMYDAGDLNDMIEELVIADGGEKEWLESYGYEDWSEANLSKKDAINAIVALKLWNTEVKEAFGFGKDDEEEEAEPEEPQTKEFTVVLQEGDKLELTDIPDEEETEEKDDSPATEEPKEENKDETDENEEDVKESDVVAKVTRPIKEEEEKIEDDEEGSVDLGTIAKVGAVGLGALALSSVFLAEDEEPFAFNADTDYSDIYGADTDLTPTNQMNNSIGQVVPITNPMELPTNLIETQAGGGPEGQITADVFANAEGSGEIEVSPYDEVREVPVHFRHDYASKDYTWKTDKEVLTDGETDEVIEMVEQIVTESDEDEGYETFDDLQGLRGHVDWDTYKDEGRFYGLAAEGGKTDASVVWELMQQNFNNPDAVRLYYTTIFGDDPHHLDQSHAGMVEMVAEAVQQNYKDPIFMHYLAKELGFEIQEAEGSGQIDLGTQTPERTVEALMRHDHNWADYEWKIEGDVTDEERDAVEDLAEDTIMVEDTDDAEGWYDDEFEFEGRDVRVDWHKSRDDGRFYGLAAEGEDFQKMTPSEFVPFDQMQEELGQMWDETTAPLADAHNYDYEPSNEPSNANFSADNVGSPSPSGPSPTPEPAEATGSEPSNEHMKADSKTKNMVLGTVALGIGLSVLLGKDKINKWFDRFGL